ncbi:PLCXc domain-containing protein [Caerostris extrusa]|uniref:PLCXc domain-containing protein n=1 Tax=Caerostris extrusa TaxID=172846 RepID=A0AAV4YDN5_CAEEX|nr:PLCXc domain-containing protein [Caerostris extrusa]
MNTLTTNSLMFEPLSVYERIQAPKVYITVSSSAGCPFFKKPYQRNIILNYYDADCERMARSSPFVGLYVHDPELDPTNHLVLRKPFACPNGRFETLVSLPYVNFDDKHNVSRCLGFWAAYLEAGRLVHSNCLRTHPDWMYNMKEIIGNKTLKCLMLPGTHDSGCYRRYDPYKDTIFDKYVYTQDESVFNQLVYGIRYIDLRIWHEGASKRASSIWITHDVFHVGLPFLKDVLHQVKDFVLATKEIVIIDFHRKLTGFFISGKLKTWQHREVIELGKEIFGNLLIDSKYSSKPLDFSGNRTRESFSLTKDMVNLILMDWQLPTCVTGGLIPKVFQFCTSTSPITLANLNMV